MTKEKILELKKEKNAVILAHYYVNNEVQEIADYIGDSFYLSKVAKNTDAEIIVFCGVRFMGESAHILNPDKKVLMPDMNADCPMAHMADADKIEKMRQQYDDLCVVCYINSTAEIKSHADVCVTSSNAVKIVKNLKSKNIFFIPDGNLGRYVKEQVTDKNIILNDGYCPIHAEITKEDVQKAKNNHKGAKFLVHPECTKEVLSLADFVGSTSDIIDFSISDDCKEYIVGTETGVFYELVRKNPDKKFYPVNKVQICPDMKLITLDKVYDVLKNETNEITLNDKMCQMAKKPLDLMLEIAK